jgi:hypothetical protein
MRAVLLLLATGIAVGATACVEPRNTRCNAVCRREAEASAECKTNDSFDQNECIAACSALIADDKNAAKVVRHIDCVTAQTTCTGVLECQ